MALQLNDPPSRTGTGPPDDSTEYFSNRGEAIRLLRDELPFLFTQDCSCKALLASPSFLDSDDVCAYLVQDATWGPLLEHLHLSDLTVLLEHHFRFGSCKYC
jgi:hypothetical protein